MTRCLPPACAGAVGRFRRAVDVWLDAYNGGLQRVRHNTAALAWDMSVNTTRQSMQRLALFGQVSGRPPELPGRMSRRALSYNMLVMLDYVGDRSRYIFFYINNIYYRKVFFKVYMMNVIGNRYM